MFNKIRKKLHRMKEYYRENGMGRFLRHTIRNYLEWKKLVINDGEKRIN